MADTGVPSIPRPADWSEAFASLPLATPPAGGWSALAARLPAASPTARARVRRRGAMAVAAALAVALPLAVLWLQRDPPAPASAPGAERIANAPDSSTSRSIDTPHASAVAPLPDDASGATYRRTGAASLVGAGDAKSNPSTTAASVPSNGDAAKTDRIRMADARSSAPPGARSWRQPRDEKRTDAATPAPAQVARETTPPASVTRPDAETELDRLQRESARLEALVAIARDERVMSAPVGVLASSIDDRIRLIDAALPTADDDATRTSLWRQRVGALQELASIEGTQRWLAVHGETLDALARVD